MYYPYLRARQFELISLRELALDNIVQGWVMPILEPVKEGFSNLDLAYKVFADTSFHAFLIVNPFEGDVKGDGISILSYIASKASGVFYPAFHYNDNADYINRCINEYDLSDCMIICLDTFSDEEGLKTLCDDNRITHVVLLDPGKYRGLDRYFKVQDKKYIRLDNVFEKKSKNSDFLDISAHKFSEEHLYYSEERYSGFADFTILPKEYIDGGSVPRAVVIHLTYLNSEEDDQIWIRHFTSITNDSIANVQGKFAEAARKALIFCDRNGIDNDAIQELRWYFTEEKYPGLGIVKKISIKNHLSVVSNYLRIQNG